MPYLCEGFLPLYALPRNPLDTLKILKSVMGIQYLVVVPQVQLVQPVVHRTLVAALNTHSCKAKKEKSHRQQLEEANMLDLDQKF